LRDQLGLDDDANSQIADGGATGSRLPGGTSVGDLPTSSASAVQLIVIPLRKRVRGGNTPFILNNFNLLMT
jgi:hypothetical protein